jgi:hypothetical protein
MNNIENSMYSVEYTSIDTNEMINIMIQSQVK